MIVTSTAGHEVHESWYIHVGLSLLSGLAHGDSDHDMVFSRSTAPCRPSPTLL